MNASAPTPDNTSWPRTALIAASALAAYLLATIISGAVLGMLRVPMVVVRGGNADIGAAGLLISGAIYVIGLIPLARALGGSRAARAIAVAVFLYAASVNTAIEASVFTTFGGTAFLVAMGVLPSLAVGGVLARLGDNHDAASFAASVGDHLSTLKHRHTLVRFALAWLCFPVVYFVFGSMIAPIVTPVYQAGTAGLLLPPLGTIMLTQLGRSAIYLVSVVPILVLLRGSTASQIGRLGLAYFTLVGLSALVSATFFPMLLRVVHSVEICADSFAYAALLVLLLGRRSASHTAQPSAA